MLKTAHSINTLNMYWRFYHYRVNHSLVITSMGLIFQSTQFEEGYQKELQKSFLCFSAQRSKIRQVLYLTVLLSLG